MNLKKAREGMLILFAFLFFIIMPIIIYDHYYEMAYIKWTFSQNCMIILFLLSAVLSVLIGMQGLFGTKREKSGNTFLLVDLFVLLYGVSNFVTFLGSENPMAAWMGTDGWYMGTVMQILLLLTYWAFSREEMTIATVETVCLGGTVFPAIVAVFQRLGNDFLHLYWDMPDEVQRDYISTIGNRTWFSGYFCTVYPIAIWLFICESKRVTKLWLGIYLFISFACLVVTFSDSAYGAMGVVLYVAGVLSLRKKEYFADWLKVVTLLPAACIVMEVCRRMSNGLVREARGVAKLLLDFRFNMPMFLICAALLGLLLQTKNEKPMTGVYTFLKKHVKLWCILPAAMLAVGVLFIVLNTNGLLPFTVESGMFVFNGMWGDGRGIIWPITLEMYQDLSPVQKLFGVGQDCYALHAYSIEYYAYAFQRIWGDAIMPNAHNEWLNMLVCGGLFGLISYAGIFISSIYVILKESGKSNINLGIGVVLSIFSYMVHNFFCYQQVTAVVPMFILLGMAAGSAKSAKKSTKSAMEG